MRIKISKKQKNSLILKKSSTGYITPNIIYYYFENIQIYGIKVSQKGLDRFESKVIFARRLKMQASELKAAVSRVLESNGVLAEMRAQLRLSVFQAIDDSENSGNGSSVISGRRNAKRDALTATGTTVHDFKINNSLFFSIFEIN